MAFDENCHRCQESFVPAGLVGLKTYEVTGNTADGQVTICYNVTQAYAYAARYCRTHELPQEIAEKLIITNLSETFCGAHVEHVECSIPPIVGTRDGLLILLDGTHRLFKMLKEGKPLSAYLLNESQTRQFEM